MKRACKFIYLTVVALVIAALSLVVAACSKSNSTSKAKYTLTFMNGTAPYHTITATAGSKIVFDKENPTRANLEFDGWSDEPDGSIVELPTKMPAESKTYYAVFSSRYIITFDAGAGSLAAEVQTKRVRAGGKLYDLVSDIVPTAAGDSKFAAWYYSNAELSASSDAVMPASNITVVAKYKVGYTVNEYKQTEYGADSYSKPSAKTGEGYVGDMIPVSSYTGYTINDDKDDKAATVALTVSASDNVYDVYYNFRDITIVFNHNLPNEDVRGEMSDITQGYGVNSPVPECKFSAVGYRFIGWSKTANGKAEYFVGQNFKVEARTTLYAVWNKGLVDASGDSTDFIYIMDGTNGAKTVLLERFRAFTGEAYFEVEGTYNETTHEFSFKNDSDTVFLRGIVDLDSKTFIYLDLADSTTYKLNSITTVLEENDNNYQYVNIKNEISDVAQLVVKSDGDLVYTDAKGAVKNGTLSYDHDGDSLMFVGDNDFTFHFRLAARETDDGDVVPVFEIRDDSMYGVRYQLTQSNKLDGNSYMILNGYGIVTTVNRGFTSITMSSSSLTGVVTSGYYYVYESEGNSDVKHGCISLYKNGYVRTTYMDFIKSSVNYGSVANPIYYVYAVNDGMEGTLYAKPATSVDDWDAYKNADTTAKIELDGYGVYAESAKYTFINSQNQKQTVTGKYNVDLYLGELHVYTSGGEYVFFLDTETVDDEDVLVFKTLSGAYESRPIMGLGNYNMYYRLRLIDETSAKFAFNMPVADSFLGIYEYDLKMITMFGGTYSKVGTDEDGNDVYEFIADESFEEAADTVYYIFYLAYGTRLTIDNFRQFKFIEATGYLSDGSSLPCFSAVSVNDGLAGYTITVDEVTYTLDGYGTATPEEGEAISYTFAQMNDNIIFVTVSVIKGSGDEEVTETIRFVGVEQDGVMSFKRMLGQYITLNAEYLFAVALLEDNYAIVGYIQYSATSASIVYYSMGTVALSSGVYSYSEFSCASYYNARLLSIYGDFTFTIAAAPTDKENGKINIGDGINTSVTTAGVGTLALNREDPENVVATYTNEEGVVYSGSYTVSEDLFVLSYTTVDGEEETGYFTFRLKFDGDGNVESFSEVGSEAGTWVQIDNSDNMMILYAENYQSKDVVVGVNPNGSPIKKKFKFAKAEYIVDDETITGEYYRTTNTDYREFCFIANEGEEDEVRFLFAIGNDAVKRLPAFIVKMYEVAAYVYTSPTASGYAAALISDGYSAQLMTATGTMYGTVTRDEGTGVITFRDSTYGYTYYFAYVSVSGQYRLVLLDGTVTAPSYGVFACTDGSGDIFGDGKEIQEVRFTGYGIAYLITGEEEDESGDTMLSGYSVYYNISQENFFVFYIIDSNNNAVIISVFRLYRSGTGTQASDYTISFADFNLYYLAAGVFNGDNYTSLYFDGFNGGVYVDERGVQHSVTYAKVQNTVDDAIIVEMVYLGDNGYVYMVVAIEDGKFTVLDEEDPRYPQPDEDDDEGEDDASYALAA